MLALLYTNTICAQNKLLGITPNGGVNDNGVMFNCNLDGTAYTATALNGTSSPNGRNPYSSFTLASNAKIYGLVTTDQSAFPYGNGYKK